MKNSELLAQQLLEASGAIQCFDIADIIDSVRLVFSQPQERERLVSASRAFVEQNNGALQRTVDLIDDLSARADPDINLFDAG